MSKPSRNALILVVALLSACQKGQNAGQPVLGTVLEGAAIGGSFTLSDTQGKRVSWDQFKGKYRIVYFGYASCPDACPTDVARMMQGLARFAKDSPALARQIQPIFITIDPARDSAQKLAQFTAAFSPDLMGLRGTEAETAAAARAFKVYYARGETKNGFYLMDHSRFAYLMDRDGKPIEALPIEQGAPAVAEDLAKLIK